MPPEVPLAPSLEVAYQRVTLADLAAGTRVTLDAGLVAGHTEPGGRLARLDDDHVVVETKGGARAGEADRLLLAAGHRPRASQVRRVPPRCCATTSPTTTSAGCSAASCTSSAAPPSPRPPGGPS